LKSEERQADFTRSPHFPPESSVMRADGENARRFCRTAVAAAVSGAELPTDPGADGARG